MSVFQPNRRSSRHINGLEDSRSDQETRNVERNEWQTQATYLYETERFAAVIAINEVISSNSLDLGLGQDPVTHSLYLISDHLR